MTHTLITQSLLEELLKALDAIDGVAYTALDQGQVDSDLGERKHYPIKFPALLVQIASETIEPETKEMAKSHVEITLRLLTECNYYANVKKPATLSAATKGLSISPRKVIQIGYGYTTKIDRKRRNFQKQKNSSKYYPTAIYYLFGVRL